MTFIAKKNSIYADSHFYLRRNGLRDFFDQVNFIFFAFPLLSERAKKPHRSGTYGALRCMEDM